MPCKTPIERFGLPPIDDKMLEKRALLNTELETIVREAMVPMPGFLNWRVRMYKHVPEVDITEKCASIRHVIDKIRGDNRKVCQH